MNLVWDRNQMSSVARLHMTLWERPITSLQKEKLTSRLLADRKQLRLNTLDFSEAKDSHQASQPARQAGSLPARSNN